MEIAHVRSKPTGWRAALLGLTYGLSIILIIIGIAIFYNERTKPIIKSDADLVEVEGTFARFHYWKGSGNCIYLNESNRLFYIPGEANLEFSKNDFKVQMHKGDPIKLFVSKAEFNQPSIERVKVFGIYSSSNGYYLLPYSAILEYNSRYSRLSGWAFSIGLVLFLVIRFVFRVRIYH